METIEEIELEIAQDYKVRILYYIDVLDNMGYDGIGIFNDSIYQNYNDLLKDEINIQELRSAQDYLHGFKTALLYSKNYLK